MASLAVQKISVANQGAFVINFSIHYLDQDGNVQSVGNSGNFPVGTTRSLNAAELGVPAGSWMWPTVHALAGSTVDGHPKVRYEPNGQTANYIAHGTTFTLDVYLKD